VKDEVEPLMIKAEALAQEKLSTDIRLEHKRADQVYNEVIAELERYLFVYSSCRFLIIC
jgi:hypothetical protein